MHEEPRPLRRVLALLALVAVVLALYLVWARPYQLRGARRTKSCGAGCRAMS
jgi:hypothetical protein